MALYVDSADRSAVEPLLATGLFAGITTNPALLGRAGLSDADLPAVYQWATAAGAAKVFMQTLGTTQEEILASANRLRDLGPRAVVKIPATRAGFAAARLLTARQVPVLITAVYHAAQALFADAAGARYIAPYVGRMTDQGRNGVEQAIAMQRLLAGKGTRVLVASLRGPDDVAALAAAGVPDFALGAPLCEALLADELTLAAAAEFEATAAG
ncbi:transaldolase family protein [Spongiactinospora sp. 9N601]|uniref:transaldolase family protein n=1 Tax=Spongiactinospora sp. 9N601 TaxID=3375149 RepID=UPI00378F39F6